MNVKLIFSNLAITAAAVPAQAAIAQGTGAAITAGASVKDTAGGEVGTITKVDGNFVILKTDRHEVRLPANSFTAHQGGYIFAMTRDQLNGEVDNTLASAAEKLVAGATVSGSQGGKVGTIEAIDAEFVTIKLASGTLVRLPRSGVAPGPDGAVIGLTAAQLEAQAAGAGAANAPAAEKGKTKAQ